MAPAEPALRCLAVAVRLDAKNEIDSFELTHLLDDLAGSGQWMTTLEWLFVEPPQSAAGEVTAPVSLPEEIAVKAILADLTNEPHRILFDHAMTPAEIRRWRWVAFQMDLNPEGRGRFPWERGHG
ncbi:hypothetical protein [Brevundimonas goettingensis]|uniref:Uncharacterized protein n=1 Tax=Brevundimonas goettingensis TaxID=2774190 RepID=A0A975C3F5_9CAUL|nr:hypothetical protein [Brevundimonas goettingensis]QTC90862.1 hypothetical protein IFJ75_16790 [Brevundimonas goettingensis]